VSIKTYAQCTPSNCLNALPPYGGICDSSLIDGRINEPYYDVISFHITDACVDLGSLDPQYSGIGAKMLKLHSISFSGLPAGLSGATNQTQYDSPANGCGFVNGTPSEIGEFEATIHLMANIRTWPFSTSCSGIIPPIDENDQAFDGNLKIIILPDPSFTGLDTGYCLNAPPVTLIPTGTHGGYFIGPGVSVDVFNPSDAGVGTHQIKYIVSAQEGTAIAPATDSSIFTVVVNSPIENLVKDTACIGSIYEWRGTQYTTPGTYYDTLNFCDSIFTLELDFFAVDTNIIQNGSVLTANATDASFQWVDCDNGFAAINGETSHDFNISVNGNYAVIVTQSNCTDTSACIVIANASSDNALNSESIKLYPNPNDGNFMLELNDNRQISIYNILGKVVYTFYLPKGSNKLKLNHLPNGVYTVKIDDKKISFIKSPFLF